MRARLAKEPLNILICGVGGQGNILASELFASALVEKDYYTTVGETYGASQRGGSVMSHVRISEKHLYGPLIPRGQADVVVGFEPVETLRVAREFANSGTQVIYNPRPNYPIGVLKGDYKYPEINDIENELRQMCTSVHSVKATDIALELGSIQGTNIVLVGALTALPEIPLDPDTFDKMLANRFQGLVLEQNRQLFKAGREKLLA
jgi:indolepyruvate ferredoxin oxidoreductase beta subunit